MSTKLNFAPTNPANQVVFVLDNVSDWQSLLGNIPVGAEVHVLDSDADGLAQMASLLDGRNGILAVHLISHGSAGSLALGTVTLSSETLAANQSSLARMGAALTESADLLLYGCDVASGDAGARFLEALAAATGADVAASTNRTGAAALGGDAVLETVVGTIETATLDVAALSGVLLAPTITSDATAPAIAENSSIGTVVYTAVATKGDGGDSLAYSLGGFDAAMLRIDSTTGAVTLRASANYETQPNYSFTVSASDGVNSSAEQAVTLAVSNLDEVAPAITSGATATAINENSGARQVVYTATSSDTPDYASGSTSYSLSGTDTAAFTINASTGEVTLTGNPDFETKPSYSFTVVATDAAGNASEKAVTLAINNLDEVAPTLTSGTTATAINENSGADQVVYTATSTDTADTATGTTAYSLKPATGDATAFSINASTGAVSLTANPDFETKPSYSFTVVATDAAGNFGEQAVTLNVMNVNEAPRFTDGAMLAPIDEDTANPSGATVLSLYGSLFTDVDSGNTLAGVVVVADASTPEQGVWQYLAGSDSTWVAIGSVSLTAGLVLRADTQLRFLPVASTEDTPSYSGAAGALSVHAMDSSYSGGFTSRLNPVTYDTTTDGASAPVSATAVSLSTSVNNIYIDGSSGRSTLVGTDGNDAIRSYSGDDTLSGGKGNDSLKSGKGDDVLRGGEGNDALVGGLGNDLMDGGAGDDTFLVDSSYDTVIGGDGIDTVTYALGSGFYTGPVLTYTLGADLENLILGSTRKLNGVGNASANQISGNAEDNLLDGKGGTDTLTGGAGNDTYVVDAIGDVIVENADQGTDSVQSSVSFVLADNIENLTLTGTAAINATGNVLANQLTGNAGNNLLDGGEGADTLVGGAGDDTYGVDNLLDVITEGFKGGVDQVRVNLASYTLGFQLENATIIATGNSSLTGNGENNVLTGNDAANTLTGLAGNDTLDGAGGADTLIGGAGNDIYHVDNAGDSVDERGGSGIDTVLAALDYALYALNDANNLLKAEVEHLTLTGPARRATGNALDNTLTGNALANTLIGLAGNDTLNGGSGADTLLGGAGNDTYGVDDAGDVVDERDGSGTDTVLSSTTYTLDTAAAAGVENLTLTGSDAINATGNALANTLRGNAGNNVLNGGAGADKMAGGAGDDTYVVDHFMDRVTEGADGGTDLVQVTTDSANGTYTLDANLENATLRNNANYKLNGNTLANILTGNAYDNVLNGGGGADRLVGGAGNDTYVVDNTLDVASEIGGGGVDTVEATVSYSLNTSEAAEIEHLTLTGLAGINATGNALANTLRGNAGANLLDGGLGVDILYGGAGNDTYVVDNALDTVSEFGGSGTDTVQASVSYTLNTFSAAEVENLVLTGTGAINATGNALANSLTGNAADNLLDGGTGADTMLGGAGNDTYAVDHAGDVVTEGMDGGTDLVRVTTATANGSYTLGTNVENASLLNAVNFSLTGNALNNVLTGNAYANELTGGSGADTLAGSAGADRLTGGAGADIFRFSAGDSGQYLGFDLITDYSKGLAGIGDQIDYSAALTLGGAATAASPFQAAIDPTTGIASFSAASGTTLFDALGDIAGRFTAAADSQGEFAFFKVNGAGDYHLFVSDGMAGVGRGDVVVQLLGVSSIAGIDLTGGNLTLIF